MGTCLLNILSSILDWTPQRLVKLLPKRPLACTSKSFNISAFVSEMHFGGFLLPKPNALPLLYFCGQKACWFSWPHRKCHVQYLARASCPKPRVGRGKTKSQFWFVRRKFKIHTQLYQKKRKFDDLQKSFGMESGAASFYLLTLYSSPIFYLSQSKYQFSGALKTEGYTHCFQQAAELNLTYSSLAHVCTPLIS